MPSTLKDLGLLELKSSAPEEILLDLTEKDQVRFRLREAGFSGYHWYVSEMTGGTIMLTTQSIAGKSEHQVNIIAFGEGTSRFRLREARPFSPEQAAHEVVIYVTVQKLLNAGRDTAAL